MSVIRIEVRRIDHAGDPHAAALRRDAAARGVALDSLNAARVYLIEADMSAAQVERVRAGLLTNPVVERSVIGTEPAQGVVVEVHPLPGVMDPAARSVADAVRELVGVDASVATGWRYDLGHATEPAAAAFGALVANPVVQAIHREPYHPRELPRAAPRESRVREVALRALSDDELPRLSRDAHLFLDALEMRAIRDHYRALGREPTEIELETLAQTWSEHCVHKTLKSVVRYREQSAEEALSGATERRGVGAPSQPAGEADRPRRADPIVWRGRPGHAVNDDGSVTIHNLLKSTVAAATHELMAEDPEGLGRWCLSVFKDNAGVVALDDHHAVCIKVETHNHPSAIEPYGGAATGVGGCIRDVIGTGLGAKPIANTDVFCVAHPDGWIGEPRQAGPTHPREGMRQGADEGVRQGADEGVRQGAPERADARTPSTANGGGATKLLPSGCLPPRRVLTRVVAGVRDYGNRMGIPTLNGAVYFDDRYVGNPLVFCGCVGVMPRGQDDSMISGSARPGDLIVALGGRTGRDGIHGATFSSAELTDTHADEFSHAVQIGNAIEEKRVLDAILRARGEGRPEGGRDGHGASGGTPLFSAITDCGAGGFSSAVGEMGAELGAEVHLERAPLKYPGLTATEIWISEAQERMVLAVPPATLDALRRICDEEHVELAVLGTFGTPDADLILRFHGHEVGRLSMRFLHDGIPTPTREAIWKRSGGERDKETERHRDAARVATAPPTPSRRLSVSSSLLQLLAHPNIASKHWIIRQYDHEVQGNTLLKPLVGPGGRGPSDAAVIEPVPGSGRGVALACGLATAWGDPALGGDPYRMALAAIDECVRNLVCVGADPSRIAILDNFCWPSCAKPENLAALVRAAEGCYDAAKAYRAPFVSGKDSLNNQFTTRDGRTIEIPPTLLITGLGLIEDTRACVTMDLKRPGNALYLIEPERGEARDNPLRLRGSHYEALFGGHDQPSPASEFPRVDLVEGPRHARAVAHAIRRGHLAACHDSSDGGPLVAVAEMLIAAHTAERPFGAIWTDSQPPARLWSERPSCYLVEVHAEREREFADLMVELGTGLTRVGHVTDAGSLTIRGDEGDESVPVEHLARAWRGTLDW